QRFGTIPSCDTMTGCTKFMAAHCTSRKQHGLLLFLLHKVRDADARESIAAVGRVFEFLQQRGADTREVVAARGWELGRLAARRGLESAGAKLHRHRASDELPLRESLPERMRLIADVVGDFFERD